MAKTKKAVNSKNNKGAVKQPYRKPNPMDQLKKLKAQQDAEKKNQQRKKAAAPKQEPIMEQVEIVAEQFTYTKDKPMVLPGWKLFKSINGQIVALPEDRKEDERYFLFDLKDGIVFLVTKPTSRYAYFRDTRFNDFMTRYGITKVLRKDPNGEYQGKQGKHRNTVSHFTIVTDGTKTETDKSVFKEDGHAVIELKAPNKFVHVEGASFVFTQQLAHRTDDENVQPFILRQLITDKDVFEIEEEFIKIVRAHAEVVMAEYKAIDGCAEQA